jgi:hypothetical protein
MKCVHTYAKLWLLSWTYLKLQLVFDSKIKKSIQQQNDKLVSEQNITLCEISLRLKTVGETSLCRMYRGLEIVGQ